MFDNRFTSRIHDRDASIAAFEAHNAFVRQTVPTHKLLEWRAEDGREAICQALDMPVPAEPFPHANTTEEFLARRNSSIPTTPA